MDTKRMIKSVLDFDPVAEAEDMVGGELDQSNFGIGLAFVQDKRAMLNRLMAITGDVCSDTKFHDYYRIASDFGFRLVYEERFPNREGDATETFMVLWHDAGFLLTLESYTWTHSGEVNVNRANIYYNIECTTDQLKDFWNYTSSGRWVRHHEREGDTGNVWAGDHDVRDGLKYHMGRLMEHGTPLAVWVESPLVWLINYAESNENEKAPWSERSDKWEELRKAKVNAMPAELRDMLVACTKER